jgi:hypothetical protein
MPAKKSKRRVVGRPTESINEAAWRRYQERQALAFDDYNHGRDDRYLLGLDLRPHEPSEGDGTAFAVIETNLDDGSRNPPPRETQVETKNTTTRKPREIGIDALAGWADNQPWWVRLPMWQFVIVPLWSLKLLFWMFAMGFVLYFMSGGGAP